MGPFEIEWLENASLSRCRVSWDSRMRRRQLGKIFQAEGIVGAKTLSQEKVWYS